MDSRFRVVASDLTYDVPFFGHLTSKKVTFFRKFNIANHDPIEAKFYTEMHMSTPIPHVNFYKDQINLTYVSMATNVPL